MTAWLPSRYHKAFFLPRNCYHSTAVPSPHPTQSAEIQEASPIDLPDTTMTVTSPTEQIPLYTQAMSCSESTRLGNG